MKHSWESRVGVSERAFQNWLQPISKPALGTIPSASEFSCINYVCLFIPLVPLHKTHYWWALSLKCRVILENKNHTLCHERQFSDLTHSGKYPYTQTLGLVINLLLNAFHPNSYCYILYEEAAFFGTGTCTSCCWDVENKAGGGKKRTDGKISRVCLARAKVKHIYAWSGQHALDFLLCTHLA